MASNSSINGLNLIPSPSQNTPKDSEEMSLEIDPQLQFDLWTNFPFGGSATTSTMSEEPYFSAERDTASRSRHKNRDGSVPRSSSHSRAREEKQESAETTPAPSQPAVNENLLNSFNSLYPYMALQQLQQQHGRINPLMFPWAAASNPLAFPPLQQQQQLDALLSGFPVDPFLVPPLPAFGAGAFPGAIGQSLPPLTIRDSKGNKTGNQPEQERVLAIDPALSLKTTSNTASSSPDNTARPAKKQRLSTTKAASTAAVSDRDSPIEPTHAPTPTSAKATSSSTAGATAPSTSAKPNATPLTASEDKRRRNTAASARFRLKKKEREAAMETRAKDLEDRVIELERECESLKKENGWLKGLVVGATTGDGLGSDGLEELLSAVKKGGAPNFSNLDDVEHTTAPVVEERVGSKRKRGNAA